MIETKCKTCLGCNRLELEDFKEICRCENYVKGVKKDNGYIRNYINSNS